MQLHVKVAQSSGLRVLQRELEKSQKGGPSFETLHSCAATLEDENTAHVKLWRPHFFRVQRHAKSCIDDISSEVIAGRQWTEAKLIQVEPACVQTNASSLLHACHSLVVDIVFRSLQNHEQTMYPNTQC